MDGWSLTARERSELESIVARPQDARQLKRAQGLLALADGEPATHVARRLRVGRSTLYDWVASLRRCRTRPAEGLKDRPRSGRLAAVRQRLRRRLPELLKSRPADWGYRHAQWTADLLRDRLAREQMPASDTSVRRALHALGYRWKRPRYVLRRRPATWRQSKGGSAAG